MSSVDAVTAMRISLQVISGPHEGRSFEFTGHDTFVVGRAGYAHFKLPGTDTFFSRAHFMVEVNPPLCHLVDMGSTNGTFVNGERVSETELQDQDEIRGGKTVFKVAIDDVETRVPGPVEPPLQDRGRVFGHFRIQRELGRGGMGVVYLASDERTRQLVALKMLRASSAATDRDRDVFVREASILSKLRHPFVVRFHESGQFKRNVYFAMEYVESTDCQKHLKKKGQLPIRHAISITCQLLAALDYAHSKDFVHRDIKPANLLLYRHERQLRVKLADFGLARVYQQSKLSGLTATGDWGGSLPFMPPEQITDYAGAKPSTDIFAVAATLYNLLTNRFIHDFPAGVGQRLAMILEADHVPIQERRADIPSGLAEAIAKGLNREPDKRFESANRFRRALLPYMKQKPAT